MRCKSWVGLTFWMVGAGCTLGAEPEPDQVEVEEPERPPLALTFNPITLPRGEASPTLIASTAVQIGDRQPQALSFTPLLRESQSLGTSDFGVLVDERGEVLERPTCGSADHGGLLGNRHGLFHVTVLDCEPSAVWITRLGRTESGGLGPVSSRPVDLSGLHGAAHLGRASVTPWNTVLVAGYGEGNAARISESGAVRGEPVGPYDPEAMAAWHAPTHRPYVYDHGWVIEVEVTSPDGAATAEKRYAMGRFAHGTARVMPDRRTVYLTDDTTNGGLFLFLADTAGDLSSGTLYVARFDQESAEGGGSGRLTWANLGPATDAEIHEVIADGTLHFQELFTGLDEGGAELPCPEDHFVMRDAWGIRCEKPTRKHSNAVVHRLETRRSAIGARATLELRDAGALVHDPDHNVLYLAVESIDRGMGQGSVQWDLMDDDDMRLRENRCGGVYALGLTARPKDVDDRVMDSPYVATSMRGFILGRPDGYRCASDAVANPDDLAYLPGSGTLLIGEDSPHHANNLLWAVDVAALHSGGLASLTPILAAPPGAEVSGLDWHVEQDGTGWLTTTIQHPWADQPGAEARPGEERVSQLGVWGPFPNMTPPQTQPPPQATPSAPPEATPSAPPEATPSVPAASDEEEAPSNEEATSVEPPGP